MRILEKIRTLVAQDSVLVVSVIAALLSCIAVPPRCTLCHLFRLAYFSASVLPDDCRNGFAFFGRDPHVG